MLLVVVNRTPAFLPQILINQWKETIGAAAEPVAGENAGREQTAARDTMTVMMDRRDP